MRKTRILLASLLKPVNDTRMCEKLGKSLAKLPQTEIHLAGFSAQNLSNSADLHFHPLFHFRRLSFGRITAQWKYYKLLLQLKPDITIVSTYELLPVTVLYRILKGTEILYDIQENYYQNVRFQPTYPPALRRILANMIRLIEKVSARQIRHFFLAEKSYARELTFIGNIYTVLENKFKPQSETTLPTSQFPKTLQPENLHFLYSGTISEIYGIWEAIQLVDNLHFLENRAKLTIIGYCPQESTYLKLQENIRHKPYITLIGGNSHVPHQRIVEAIGEATIGLLPYRFNESTRNCMPTKLFEYLANGLPVLLPVNPLWEIPVRRNQAGFSINFLKPDTENILNRLLAESFYPEGLPKDVLWQEEENKLLTLFNEHIL